MGGRIWKELVEGKEYDQKYYIKLSKEKIHILKNVRARREHEDGKGEYGEGPVGEEEDLGWICMIKGYCI